MIVIFAITLWWSAWTLCLLNHTEKEFIIPLRKWSQNVKMNDNNKTHQRTCLQIKSFLAFLSHLLLASDALSAASENPLNIMFCFNNIWTKKFRYDLQFLIFLWYDIFIKNKSLWNYITKSLYKISLKLILLLFLKETIWRADITCFLEKHFSFLGCKDIVHVLYALNHNMSLRK